MKNVNNKMETIISEDKTPDSVYLMHKYWGKKPSSELREQIKKYTKEGDLILDPFAGYGGIGIESLVLGRNVILNDLNPVASFIEKCILRNDINFDKLERYYIELKNEYASLEKEWFDYHGNEIITTLRDSKDKPLVIRTLGIGRQTAEVALSSQEKNDFIKKEQEVQIEYWYPKWTLIQNSRICAHKDEKIKDLFPRRALLCHSYLYDKINQLQDSPEKELLRFAFLSNLANCSKLVPPISSRGSTSQGAWMTGFYIGNTYLENNVFHYFENRVTKVIKGKKDFSRLVNENSKYKVMCEDAKKLSLEDESIDFVFTDFPYGDTVPYFEQSQLWNAWLNKPVDYENEIVISDSKERKKDSVDFYSDIDKSISEIYRVLKTNKYFTFTYHSLDGREWCAINKSVQKNGFQLVDLKLLSQKTLTPRQLNRSKTIKGDLVVTYKKVDHQSNKQTNIKSTAEIVDLIKNNFEQNKFYDTNDLIIICVKNLLENQTQDDGLDFMKIINECFNFDEKVNMWKLKG